jgi:ligand-binding sensor domain-containing protein
MEPRIRMRTVPIIVLAGSLIGCGQMADNGQPAAGPPATSGSAATSRPTVALDHRVLSGYPVNSVVPLAGSRVAIGTRSGLLLWQDGQTTIFTGTTFDPLRADHELPGNSPLPFNEIASMAHTGDGTTWLGTSRGLCSLRGSTLVDETARLPATWPGGSIDLSALPRHRESLTHDVMCLYAARDGRLLIGTRNAGLIVRSSTGERYDLVHSHPDANQWVTGIAELADGTIVFSVFDRGLLRLEGRTAVPFATPEGWIATAEIRCLVVDQAGALWAGTHHGVGRLAPDGGTQRFTAKDVLPDDTIWRLACDPAGAVWCFGDSGAAVSTREGWRYPSLASESPLQGMVIAPGGERWFWGWSWVARDPAVTWLSERPDLLRMKELKARVAASFPALPDVADALVVKDQLGRTWLSTGDRVFAYDGSAWNETLLSGEETVWIHFLHADRQGRIWIGTSGRGVRMIDRELTTAFNDDPRHSRAVAYALAEGPDGTIWIGTQDGLYAHGTDGWKQVFADHQVEPLHCDAAGRIWFGDINEGILVYEGGRIRNLSQQGPLVGCRATAFAATKDGDVRIHAWRSDGARTVTRTFLAHGDEIRELPDPEPTAP